MQNLIATDAEIIQPPMDDVDLKPEVYWTWTSWRTIMVMMNAVIGLIWLEMTFYRTKRFRTVPKDLDSQFPAWRRTDVASWHRLAMYPGAMTLLLPRFLYAMITVLLVAVFCRLFLIGHNLENPVTGCRRVMIRFMFQVLIRLQGVIGLFAWYSHDVIKHTDPKVDYEEYLGPNWRTELDAHMLKNEGTSMLVCNHNGLFDIFSHLTSPLLPSFTPLAQFRKIPLFGYILIAL